MQSALRHQLRGRVSQLRRPLTRSYRLEKAFLASYDGKDPPFGFNGLGELVFYRTYSRPKPGGGRERWGDTASAWYP